MPPSRMFSSLFLLYDLIILYIVYYNFEYPFWILIVHHFNLYIQFIGAFTKSELYFFMHSII